MNIDRKSHQFWPHLQCWWVCFIDGTTFPKNFNKKRNCIGISITKSNVCEKVLEIGVNRLWTSWHSWFMPEDRVHVQRTFLQMAGIFLSLEFSKNYFSLLLYCYFSTYSKAGISIEFFKRSKENNTLLLLNGHSSQEFGCTLACLCK